MKILNADLVALTEIKLYFLDPPTTFKLAQYASERLTKAIEILKKYPFVATDFRDKLETLQQQTKESSLPMQELKERLKEAGKEIAAITNK